MYCETPYGVVAIGDDGNTVIVAAASELRDWASRPGEVWPCSCLARVSGDVRVVFDSRGDLIDVGGDNWGAPSDELNAWTSDVLRLAGIPDHPAIR